MHLNELKALHVSEVLKQADELEIENTGRMRKQELMFAIIKKRARAGEQVFADGVLEILPDGFGFLRSPDTSSMPRGISKIISKRIQQFYIFTIKFRVCNINTTIYYVNNSVLAVARYSNSIL